MFAIGMSKRLLNRSLESSFETALEEEALVQSLVTQSEDTREGMTAFMERRTPQLREVTLKPPMRADCRRWSDSICDGCSSV
jgi:hypothetical protein